MKIGVLGAGAMGGAIYQGLVRSNQFEKVFLCDRNPEKIKSLEARSNFRNLEDLIKESDWVILAIKPHAFAAFAKEHGESLKTKGLISVLAGVSLKKLESDLPARTYVAAMPNLPVALGKGLTSWLSSSLINLEDKKIVQEILGALGSQIKLSTEKEMHAFTAVAGCGPAYFFNLCEQLKLNAERFGFSAELARLLAEQTFIGAASLLESSQKNVSELKKSVASKGGVTQAALDALDSNGFNENFSDALDKAVKRLEN